MILIPTQRYVDDRDGRAQVSEFRSELITLFLGALVIEDGVLKFEDPRVDMFIEFFKQMTWHFVIDDPRLAAIRIGQRQVIETCFNSLYASAQAVFIENGVMVTPNEHKKRALHPRLLDYVNAGSLNPGDATPWEIVARAVADYICSLTDMQTYELAGQLTGSATYAVPSSFLP